MKTKKVLKIIGIIVVILILGILALTMINYTTIKGLQNKMAKYSNSTNYYIKLVTTEDNATTVTTEYYKKDNKQAVFIERNINGEISRISMYNNGTRTDTFYDNKENKTAQLDNETFISVSLYNQLETDSDWLTFWGSIFTRISSKKYNGKECYVIKGFTSPNSLTFKDAEIYIEKDTGLLVKSIEGNRITEREYKFDNVEDTIFFEPDISQYTLKVKE